MKWVTRKNANVDRIACPWLISKFVDADAEFLFVPADEVTSVAEREGALPYDVPEVELGHVDGRCSFESIIVKYEIKDPALDLLAKIVQWSRRLSGSGHRARGSGALRHRQRLRLGLLVILLTMVYFVPITRNFMRLMEAE